MYVKTLYIVYIRKVCMYMCMLKYYKVLKNISIKGGKRQAGDCVKGEMIYCVH